MASNAFNHPPLKHLADHPIWARNPKFAMLPKEAEYAHPRGWPAKPNEAVQRIEINYILPDMVAKAVNGMPHQARHGLGAGAGRLGGQGTAQGERLAWPSAARSGGGRASAGPGRLARCASGGSRSTSSATASSCRPSCCSSCLVAYPVRDGHLLQPLGLLGRLARQLRRAGNYREILGNEIFRQTVQNSFVFTAIALTPQDRARRVAGACCWPAISRSSALIRGAVLLPFVIPTALSTLAWCWMFDSLYSVVNWTGIRLGLISAPGPNWLGQSDLRDGRRHRRERLARAALLRHHRAGRARGSIPREFYEAAEVDGASRWPASGT